MGQYAYILILFLLHNFFMTGSTWLVEYHDDIPISWQEAAASCGTLGGVLANPDDQSCFLDLKPGWIGQGTSNVGDDCGYYDGISTSTTKCSTLLPFYCKIYAIQKVITNGSQRRLSNLNIKIENHNSFRIRLQTCAMSEISFHTVPGSAVYTVRVGEQNSKNERNIIIYRTEDSNTEFVNATVISYNDACEQYQWYSMAWKEDSGNNFLYFYHGQNLTTAGLASKANMTFRSVSDVTLSSYAGKATWYIYVPPFYETSIMVNYDTIINMSPKPNIVAFELKSCHFGKITVLSVTGQYTYHIIIDGIAEREGRSVYIRDTTANNVTRRIFADDIDECSNYRFYWIQLVEENDNVDIFISRSFEEFHKALLLPDPDSTEDNVVMFYGILRDSRIVDEPTNNNFGEWNFYSNDVSCFRKETSIGTTLPLPSQIVTFPKTVTVPTGVKTMSPLTIDISTGDKRPFTNKPLSSSMEENEHGRKVQIIAIAVGSAALILIGLGIFIASMVIKTRVHKNKLDDHHHRKSLAGIVFPSDITLSPISLSRLHSESRDNIYNSCEQGRLQQLHGGQHNYLTMDDNSETVNNRRRREQSHFEDSIDNINLDEQTGDHLYQRI